PLEVTAHLGDALLDLLPPQLGVGVAALAAPAAAARAPPPRLVVADARQLVLERRERHLEARDVRARSPLEDAQDDAGAVEQLDLELGREGARVPRGELAVEDHQRGRAGGRGDLLDEGAQLLPLARAEHAGR